MRCVLCYKLFPLSGGDHQSSVFYAGPAMRGTSISPICSPKAKEYLKGIQVRGYVPTLVFGNPPSILTFI